MGFHMQKKEKEIEKSRLIIGGAIGCCLIMVAFPQITALASKEAVSIWLNSVVPTLLPFFIAANFLKKTGIVGRIPTGIYPLAMALLSGYPMGAKIAGDDYREGLIDKEQLYKILSYSMVTGPAFLIGAVGAGFLGSHRLGVILAVSHYAGAWLNSFFYDRKKTGIKPSGSVQSYRKTGYYDLLTDSILESFRSLAVILAYIVMFMIVTDLLQFSGLLRMLPGGEAAALVKGILEMTVGCSSLSACSCSAASKAAMASFMVSFGGLSVMGQSMSMLRGCNVSLRRILLMKLSQGLISGLLAFSLACFMVR